jgi:hypothetical protein
MTYLKRLLGINGKDLAIEEERKKLKEALKKRDIADETVQKKLRQLIESTQKTRHLTER